MVIEFRFKNEEDRSKVAQTVTSCFCNHFSQCCLKLKEDRDVAFGNTDYIIAVEVVDHFYFEDVQAILSTDEARKDISKSDFVNDVVDNCSVAVTPYVRW